VLTAVKALLMPLAKLDMPAVAANATNAIINTYSIKPWPASSLCRRTSVLRIRFVISRFLLCFVAVPAPEWGSRWGTPNAFLQARQKPNTFGSNSYLLKKPMYLKTLVNHPRSYRRVYLVAHPELYPPWETIFCPV